MGDLRPLRDSDWLGFADSRQTDTATIEEKMGISWVYEEDDKVLMMGGVAQYWPGVGQAWITISDAMRGRPVLAFRVALRVFRKYLVPNYHRIEALVPVNFPEGVRFVLALGFKLESVAHRYGTDKLTYLRYVYLRGE